MLITLTRAYKSCALCVQAHAAKPLIPLLVTVPWQRRKTPNESPPEREAGTKYICRKRSVVRCRAPHSRARRTASGRNTQVKTSSRRLWWSPQHRQRVRDPPPSLQTAGSSDSPRSACGDTISFFSETNASATSEHHPKPHGAPMSTSKLFLRHKIKANPHDFLRTSVRYT